MHSPNPISLTPSILTSLEVCSEESVYAPGYIQPHGILLMLQEPHLRILQISENVEQFFGISAEALLGQPLQRLFSQDQVQRLAGYLAQDNLELCNPFQLKTRRRVAQTDWQRKNQTFTGVMYRMVDGLILELEPQRSLKSTHSTQFYHRLQGAIALWEKWHPHLILMDIQMPVVDGYEITRQIRGGERGKDAVIIAVTAYAFEEDYTTSIQVGCNDHINKPFIEAILFEKIAHYLRVRYCYREKALPGLDQENLFQKSLTAKDLQVMSPEWIIQVHQAALDLNDAELYNLITQIPNQEQFLANALKYLVENFELEAIATLTQTQ